MNESPLNLRRKGRKTVELWCYLGKRLFRNKREKNNIQKETKNQKVFLPFSVTHLLCPSWTSALRRYIEKDRFINLMSTSYFSFYCCYFELKPINHNDSAQLPDPDDTGSQPKDLASLSRLVFLSLLWPVCLALLSKGTARRNFFRVSNKDEWLSSRKAQPDCKWLKIKNRSCTEPCRIRQWCLRQTQLVL